MWLLPANVEPVSFWQSVLSANSEALATVTGIVDGTGSVGAAIGQVRVNLSYCNKVAEGNSEYPIATVSGIVDGFGVSGTFFNDFCLLI